MVNEEELGRLLLRVESDVHRGGWDRPGLAFMFVDAGAHVESAMGLRRILRGAGPSVRVGDYLAQPMLRLGGAAIPAGMTPWTALRRFAMTVAYGESSGAEPVVEVLGVLRMPGIFGFASVNEKWGSKDAAALRQAVAGEVNLGDVPGSVETRHLIAVTTTARVMTVERVRGSKPVLRPDEDHLRGDISTSLRILCDAITGQVPPIDEFEERYPTLSELAGRQQK